MFLSPSLVFKFQEFSVEYIFIQLTQYLNRYRYLFDGIAANKGSLDTLLQYAPLYTRSAPCWWYHGSKM